MGLSMQQYDIARSRIHDLEATAAQGHQAAAAPSTRQSAWSRHLLGDRLVRFGLRPALVGVGRPAERRPGRVRSIG